LTFFQQKALKKERTKQSICGYMCKPKTIQMLDLNSVSYRVLKLPEKAFTAKDVARLTKVKVGEICKTMLFINGTTQEPVIIVVPGNKRVNTAKVEPLIKGKPRLARGEEVLSTTGYKVGAIPPYGHKKNITTYVDTNLMKNERINFGTGVHNLGVEIKSRDLKRVVNFGVADLT